MSNEGVVVIVPAELEPGFRLAGVSTRVAATAPEALAEVEGLMTAGMRGVIAVYEPFLADFEPERRTVLESTVTPVLVPLPTGLEDRNEERRRARISAMLSRAVGYHITFGEEMRR